MTKHGSFKHAVRQRARDTGQRYTQALADLRQISASPFVRTRPLDLAGLRRHLEGCYGIDLVSLALIDDNPEVRPRGSWPGHYPSTLFLRRNEGRPWIVRVFSSPADQVDRVSGDAEVLRFLASQGFRPNASLQTTRFRCSTGAV